MKITLKIDLHPAMNSKSLKKMCMEEIFNSIKEQISDKTFVNGEVETSTWKVTYKKTGIR